MLIVTGEFALGAARGGQTDAAIGRSGRLREISPPGSSCCDSVDMLYGRTSVSEIIQQIRRVAF